MISVYTSNPGQWYSKIKRMSGISQPQSCESSVEELTSQSVDQQADTLADFFSSTRNKFEPISAEHFNEFTTTHSMSGFEENYVTPHKIQEVIKSMKKKSSTVKDDIRIKILSEFSEKISKPLCNIINTMFEH